jgi:hypothetical protein
MDTAKVDIRKLQLLNDRINQTIEALNQVRLSVHGLSHTTGNVPTMGYPNVFGYGVQGFGPQGYGPQNYGQAYGQGYGQTGWNQTGWPQGFTGQGYSHTTGWNPGTVGYLPGIVNQNPYFTQMLNAGVNPFLGGLQHTSPETTIDPTLMARQAWGQQVWGQQTMDPYYVARMMQSFPFAQWPTTPVQGF